MLVRAAGLGKAERSAERQCEGRKRGSWGERHADQLNGMLILQIRRVADHGVLKSFLLAWNLELQTGSTKQRRRHDDKESGA